MNKLENINNFKDLEAELFCLPDFEVSWAGENPWDGGLIFGSDDGRLLKTTIDGRVGKILRVSNSGEAINGVAIMGNSMAASTRSDVTVIDFGPGGQDPGRCTGFPLGTHGVVATSTGSFAAPLGPVGLLLLESESGSPYSMRVFAPANRHDNLYKMDRLQGDGQEDLFVCAARHGGLLALTIRRKDPNTAQSFTAPNLDIVDVCALGTPRWPRAAVGLGADFSLHFCLDLTDSTPPRSLSFSAMSGTAYSILHSDGHLFLLTSLGLYAFSGLATRFLEGDEINGRILGRFIPTRAVDVYLAYNKLLIFEADRVVAVTIDSVIYKGTFAAGIDSPSLETSTLLDIPWESAPSQDWNLVPAHSN